MMPGKTIYLLEMDRNEWVWCDDPQPDTCSERKMLEYRLVGEYDDSAGEEPR